jgi:hypothetical protein
VTTTTPASFGTVAPVVGQAGRGVGYGKYLTLQTVGPGTAGQRREATMAIASVGTDTFVASPNSGNPSSGDSGGPFFVDGAIIGTVSAPPVGPITSPITNETYARLDVVYAWVNQQIATWQTTLPVTLPQIVISNGYFALSSGATNVAIGQIDTGVGWAKPASVTVTIDPTSLPSGITMSFTETIGYIPPVQGVAGGFEVSAAASVAPGTQATARVIVSDGVTSVTVTVEILVTDEPCVPQSCGNQCGVVANGCSGTMTCGCGTNETCESGECVAHGITCKAPLHNCGGYCARVCG